MIINSLILIFSLILVVRSATMATRYSERFARNFRLSKYIIGFVIIAFISIIPETFISINSIIEGIPEFGLGTLLGSNVADLTLIFAILILYSGRGIKIESKILKNVRFYPFFLMLPILFGLDGTLSRIEGSLLVITGSLFYYFMLRNSSSDQTKPCHNDGKLKNFIFLLFAVLLLIIGSHFTVTSATELADILKISPVLIAMLVVSLGTTMPELFYSLSSMKRKDDELAIGDILGTVLADATIVVGILALISPFSFPVKIVYVTGAFMVIASLVLLRFMNSGRIINKKEGYMLLAFWVIYVVTEFVISR